MLPDLLISSACITRIVQLFQLKQHDSAGLTLTGQKTLKPEIMCHNIAVM